MTGAHAPAYDAARAWAAAWGYFADGRRLGILKEVIRGHRMAASILRHSANPTEAQEIEVAIAYLEALLPVYPEGFGDPERSPA